MLCGSCSLHSTLSDSLPNSQPGRCRGRTPHVSQSKEAMNCRTVDVCTMKDVEC